MFHLLKLLWLLYAMSVPEDVFAGKSLSGAVYKETATDLWGFAPINF